MIIVPTLVIVIFCVLLVSSLITSVAANINKTYHHDHKAKEYAVSASSVGFGSLGILIAFLLYSRSIGGINNVGLYSLLWMWSILIILSALSYLSYDKLVLSKHYPTGAKHIANDTQIKLAFSAFCFTLIGLSVGITYVITTSIHEGYFDKATGNIFNVKKFFESLLEEPSKKQTEDIELDNLLVGLREQPF